MRAEEVAGISKDIRSITGLSIGICLFDGSETTETVKECADRALYLSRDKRELQVENGMYRQ